MENSQILSAFNDHFFEFIDDIQRVFPDDTDIATVKNALMQFRKMNPKLILIVFKESVLDKYRDEINKGDLNFFINKNYKSDLNGKDNCKLILDKIDCLRGPIKQMSKNDQDKSLKYIQNLSKLCDLYN